jgi:hypothetical protein
MSLCFYVRIIFIFKLAIVKADNFLKLGMNFKFNIFFILIFFICCGSFALDDDCEEEKKKPLEKNWKLVCILCKEKKRISWPKKDHFLEFKKDSLVRLSLDINVCNGLYYELDSTHLSVNVKNCSIQCCDGFTALNFADAFPDTFIYKLSVDTLELNSDRYSILLKI